MYVFVCDFVRIYILKHQHISFYGSFPSVCLTIYPYSWVYSHSRRRIKKYTPQKDGLLVVATGRSTSSDNGSRAFRFSPSITGLAVWVSWTFCLEKIAGNLHLCVLVGCACAEKERRIFAHMSERKKNSRKVDVNTRKWDESAQLSVFQALLLSPPTHSLSLPAGAVLTHNTHTHTCTCALSFCSHKHNLSPQTLPIRCLFHRLHTPIFWKRLIQGASLKFVWTLSTCITKSETKSSAHSSSRHPPSWSSKCNSYSSRFFI